MGNWLPRLSVCLALGANGIAICAAPSNWEHTMDVALQAAARQDYATSENAFLAAVRELEMGNPADSRLGPTLNSLGLVYRAENKNKEAELAFRRACVFIEKANAAESIDVGNANLNVGSVLVVSGKYNEAEPFLLKAMRIYTKQLGEKSPKSAAVMAQLGEMYRNLHDYGQAEPLLKKALDIEETARGIDDPDVASIVNSLAELYATQNLNAKAEPMFKLVMSIREATAGMDSSEFAIAVERYAVILEKIGRYQEAERHRKLASAVKVMRKTPGVAPDRSNGAVDMIAPSSHESIPPTAVLPKKGNAVARIQ